jgi:hypothetical protein
MSAKTDGVKFQLNVKNSAGTLLNFYFYEVDEEEIKKVLEVIANITPEVQAIETLYNAQGVLRQALGATAVEQSAVKSAPTSGGKACKHGEMTFRTGQSAKGPWKGHFCPSPKGTPDQCEPQFVR